MRDENPPPEASRRDLAIEGAVFAVLKFRFPRAQQLDLNRRSGWVAVEGSNEYFLNFDGKAFARVELHGPDKFTLTIID